MNRRQFIALLAAASTTPALGSNKFTLRYLLSSCLYGTMRIEDILPEASRTEATHLDLWPRNHGDQREQVAAMGTEAFSALLEKHNVKLGCISRYDLGPFKLADEFAFAKLFTCPTIVTASGGPKNLAGSELRDAVRAFCEQLKPHLDTAAECGVTLAIENHGNSLVHTPDSLRWMLEFSSSTQLGVALAPYHLPQDPGLLAALIRDLGPRLALFYAWQHGKGSMQAQPKSDELLQLPGRGPLDFSPLLAALRDIRFQGWTSIFMHPFPRGIPIVEGGSLAVSAEINRARQFLESCLPE
jgi:sugar phosphate isomerase/epimerase